MKTKLKNAIAILAIGFLLIACNKGNDDVLFLYEEEAGTPKEEVIAMGSISLNPIIKDAIRITTGKALTLEEALDQMVVQIMETDIGGMVVLNSNYRDLPTEIPLAPGNYDLLISNYSFSPSRFDSPVYGALQSYINITAGMNTSLDLELALLDVAATINFSSDIMLSYPDISVRAEYIQDGFGIGPILRWALADDGRIGYLNTYEGDFGISPFFATTGILVLKITATDATGLPVEVNKTYLGVQANQHYHITIEQTAESTVGLTVTLGDEDIINDTITFPF